MGLFITDFIYIYIYIIIYIYISYIYIYIYIRHVYIYIYNIYLYIYIYIYVYIIVYIYIWILYIYIYIFFSVDFIFLIIIFFKFIKGPIESRENISENISEDNYLEKKEYFVSQRKKGIFITAKRQIKLSVKYRITLYRIFKCWIIS